MKVKKETQIKIKISGDDINHLKSSIEKTLDGIKTVGFKNSISLTKDELDVLNKLKDNLE